MAMLAIERRNRILEKLGSEGKVIVVDLSREFGVTEETIRRDLDKLDAEGLVKKTYGGAVSKRAMRMDLPYTVRKRSNIEAKQYIASIIADLIHDGDFIMLDASSTAQYVAKLIKGKHDITLITNSLEILLELTDKSDWNVLSTGGTLKSRSLSLVGTVAEKMLQGFHVDIAVCSCKGIDMTMGITDSNEKDSDIKQAIFAAAQKKVLAIDSSKFDVCSFVRVCPLSTVDLVVTEKKPDSQWMERFKSENVDVLF